MEAVRFSHMSMKLYRTIRRHTPEDGTAECYSCEKLRLNIATPMEEGPSRDVDSYSATIAIYFDMSTHCQATAR
jgi:hypothetical protein